MARRGPIGVPVVAGTTYYWCTCGRSKTQPFCDGSHAGTPFTPLEWTAPETTTKLLCGCKRTRAAPFCDAAHETLPLRRGDRLAVGEALVAGRVTLTLQPNGALIIAASGSPLWTSGTAHRRGATHLALQPDGDLVVCRDTAVLWSAGTAGSGADRFVLEPDGNAVLFAGDDAVWATR